MPGQGMARAISPLLNRQTVLSYKGRPEAAAEGVYAEDVQCNGTFGTCRGASRGPPGYAPYRPPADAPRRSAA